MPLAIFLPLAVPLCVALGARAVAARLPPQAATWLLTVAAVALAALSTAVLMLLAGAAAIRIPLVATLGHMSLQVVRRDDPRRCPSRSAGPRCSRWPPPRRAGPAGGGCGRS